MVGLDAVEDFDVESLIDVVVESLTVVVIKFEAVTDDMTDEMMIEVEKIQVV